MKQNDSIQHEDLNQMAGIQAAAARVDDMTILENLLKPKGFMTIDPELIDEGREVKLKDALECIKRFKPRMKAHGFTMTGTEEKELKIGKMRKVTECEEFGGANLLKWMLKTVRKYDPKGKGENMGIRLTLGIYSNKFLKTYLSEQPSLRVKKQDRITIFLIPYYPNNMQKFKDDDVTAYDLGGLRP